MSKKRVRQRVWRRESNAKPSPEMANEAMPLLTPPPISFSDHDDELLAEEQENADPTLKTPITHQDSGKKHAQVQVADEEKTDEFEQLNQNAEPEGMDSAPIPPSDPPEENALPDDSGTDQDLSGNGEDVPPDTTPENEHNEIAPQVGQIVTPPRIIGPSAPLPHVPSGALSDFLQEIETHKTALSAVADTQRSAILTAATREKEAVHSLTEAKVSALQNHLDTTRASIVSEADAAESTIANNKSAHIQQAEITAAEKLNNLETLIADQQAAMLAAGASKAELAVQKGEEEVVRVQEASQTAANRARRYADASNFKQYNRQERITKVATELAESTVSAILETEQQVIATIRKDARQLADKFTKEASEGAAKMSESRAAGEARIRGEKNNAIQGIGEIANEAKSRIATHKQEALSNLAPFRDAIAEMRNVGQLAQASIDEFALAATMRLDEQLMDILDQLDKVKVDAHARISSMSENQAEEAIAGAREQLDRQVTAFRDGLNSAGYSIQGKMREVPADVAASLDRISNQALSGSDELLTAVRSGFSEALKAAAEGMLAHVENVATESDKALGEIESELQATILKSSEEWEKELKQGLTEIRNKVDQAIAEWDRQTGELKKEIDKKAREIEAKSLLKRIFSFVAGAFMGFLKALGETILMILVVLLIIAAVVAVLLLIIYMIGGLGAILGIILFLSLHAALIGTIFTALGVILTAIGVIIALVQIYQAAISTEKSDYERGQMAGEGIFTIIESFFGGKILKFIGKLFRGATKVDDGAKLLNKSEDAKDLVNKTDDGGKLRNSADESSELMNKTDEAEDLANKSDEAADLANKSDEVPGKLDETDVEWQEFKQLYDDLGDEPPHIDIDLNDAKYSQENLAGTALEGHGAHTVGTPGSKGRHTPDMPLYQKDGGKTVEGRIYGGPGWNGQARKSTKWYSRDHANQAINTYLQNNWEQIKLDLAINGRGTYRFKTGKPVGHGFVNKKTGMPGASANPEASKLIDTSFVEMTIRLDPGPPPAPFVVTAFPSLAHLK